jgi:protein TonB
MVRGKDTLFASHSHTTHHNAMSFCRSCCQLIARQIVIFIICLLLLNSKGFTQSLTASDTTIYTIVEHSPEFPGGRPGLKEYLQKNVHYPPETQKAGIKGRVFVSFTVEKDGHIADVKVLKELGYGCDEEAVRVINAMPRWKPGSQSGIAGQVALRVKYYLPVFFNIDYTHYPRPTKY